VRQYTPTCTLNATATYDKCNDLAMQFNITVPDLIEYNDDIDEKCDNLVAGKLVRVNPSRIKLP
jgi:hypothetical protein